jgi:hypothetical protein
MALYKYRSLSILSYFEWVFQKMLNDIKLFGCYLLARFCIHG